MDIIEGLCIWNVVYHHRHGTDTWPIVAITPPDEDEIVRGLEEDGVWDGEREDEWVEIQGPFPLKPLLEVFNG